MLKTDKTWWMSDESGRIMDEFVANGHRTLTGPSTDLHRTFTGPSVLKHRFDGGNGVYMGRFGGQFE